MNAPRFRYNFDNSQRELFEQAIKDNPNLVAKIDEMATDINGAPLKGCFAFYMDDSYGIQRVWERVSKGTTYVHRVCSVTFAFGERDDDIVREQ